MNENKILLSGVKPTGPQHIGNYFGAMKQFVDLQNDYSPYYIFLADYHALNLIQDANKMQQYIHDLVIDYLAIGLDPDKVVVFKQSDIPEHTELTWIFDTITTMPYLMRAHAYKDAEAKNREINVGTFNYPMLMAADILLYDADVVPVGKDQKQHVEYARDTAEKFNRIFGDTFKLPEPLILEHVATVPGIDGQKMSKSYGNTIPLFASDDEIRKLVMSIVTDSTPAGEPIDAESDNIFALHKLFTDNLTELENKYKSGAISYKDSKELLAENIIKMLSPMREKRASIKDDKDLVKKILNEGKEKASVVAKAKMNLVKRAIGVQLD